MANIEADSDKINELVRSINRLFDEQQVNASEAMSVLTAMTALCIKGFRLEEMAPGGLDEIFEKFKEITAASIEQVKERGMGSFGDQKGTIQ